MAPAPQRALVLAVVCWPVLLWSQYVPDTLVPKWRVFDAFVGNGFFFEQQVVLGLQEWSAFAGASQILKDDLSHHEQVPEHDRYAGAGGVNYAITLARTSSRSRPSAVFRVGVDFQHHPTASMVLTRAVRTPFDTLTSSQTGQITVIDSVTTSTYSMEHAYDQFGVDVTMLWLKEYTRHWSLYAGAGLIVGYTFGGEILVSRTITEEIDPVTQTDDEPVGTSEIEHFSTADEAYLAFHLPMGFGYRLGWKRKFWRALNLGFEFRPAIFYGGAPELDRGVRIGSQFLIALRVDLMGGAGVQ